MDPGGPAALIGSQLDPSPFNNTLYNLSER